MQRASPLRLSGTAERSRSQHRSYSSPRRPRRRVAGFFLQSGHGDTAPVVSAAGGAFGRTGVEQDAVRPQLGSTPPTSTVAVTVWPPRPFVSTVIVEVPWPLVIVPAETVQL